MSHPPLDPDAWAPWVAEVAASLGVAASDVAIADLLELTGTVSHRFVRPMAPVSAFLWGYARAVHPDADPRALADAVLAAIPGERPGA